ncbi:MAG TPA: hypothetical protein VKV16_04320 [Solirubrobacteraceae bacterium]|nr:hypothetical protein [Solirubrobacteraceae bacterium]
MRGLGALHGLGALRGLGAPRVRGAPAARVLRTPRASGRARGTALAALPLAALALALAGCAGGDHHPARQQQLERADFAAVCDALARIEPAVRAETAATKAAWPDLFGGLARTPGARTRAAIARAGERAAALGTPGVLGEHLDATLTGPGSGLSSQFRGASVIAARSWREIAFAVEQIEHGSALAARFARANVALYIEGVYDSHFTLAQIGKQVQDDYEKLGGAGAFAASLTPTEVRALADAYSEPRERLYPHETVKLGS